MSEEQRNVPFRVEGDKVIICADPIYITPAEIRSANVGSIVFARDLTVQDIRDIIREEMAASKAMPEMTVTLEMGGDGITERVTRIAGEVTERRRLSR